MHERVLLLGPTGLDKRAVADAAVAELHEQHGHPVRVLGFETDFLERLPQAHGLISYLQKPMYDQAQLWREAWNRAAPELNQPGVTLLNLHATAVRDYYGVRITADVDRICQDFDPTLIVTLADDVYSMWHRTEYRAQGDASRGRPTMEQLLMARRVEAMVGDLIERRQLERHKLARHVFLAVNHPVTTLTNIILGNAQIVYLSFPISAPRDLEQSKVKAHQKTAAAIKEEINAFHALALDAQRHNPRVAFVSPLAIDELPFAAALQTVHGAKKTFTFPAQKRRWPTSELWPNTPFLIKNQAPVVTNIPIDAARAVTGMIGTDVGWRDYRLVLQAHYLACYSPILPRPNAEWRIARGVAGELEKATGNFIPCHVYQNPRFDPTGEWERWLGSAGTMGSSDKNTFIVKEESVQAVIGAVSERSKKK